MAKSWKDEEAFNGVAFDDYRSFISFFFASDQIARFKHPIERSVPTASSYDELALEVYSTKIIDSEAKLEGE